MSLEKALQLVVDARDVLAFLLEAVQEEAIGGETELRDIEEALASSIEDAGTLQKILVTRMGEAGLQ